jgi:diguanylate cyclase (GGDEF)-like protein
MMEIDDTEIVNSLIYHSQEERQYTIMDFLREHVIAVLLFLVCIFGIIIAILATHCVLMAKSKKKVTDAYYQIRTAKWEAAHDALTGLLNRASFQKVCQRLKETDIPMVVMVIDVDKFKSVNDTYGHRIGDLALVKVSKILSQSFRDEDYVIRYAGDEFVVLMMNMTPKEVDVISSKINKINERLQSIEDNVPKLSVSVGIAFSESGYSDELFTQADEALYHTKENGRCGYSIYQ